MENLKQLLRSLDAETPNDSDLISKKFREIAETLMKNYHIEKGTQEYYFLDIEFYFCNSNHPDIITYPRKTEEGKWFFHQSGVDLTFNSDYTPYNGVKDTVDASKPFFFGGILVRELLKRDTSETFKGPYKCVWELFDIFDALSPKSTEIPTIVRNTKEIDIEPLPFQRKFSYSKDRQKNKYKELTEKVFCGNPPSSSNETEFENYLENKYAYRVSKEELENMLKNL